MRLSWAKSTSSHWFNTNSINSWLFAFWWEFLYQEMQPSTQGSGTFIVEACHFCLKNACTLLHVSASVLDIVWTRSTNHSQMTHAISRNAVFSPPCETQVFGIWFRFFKKYTGRCRKRCFVYVRRDTPKSHLAESNQINNLFYFSPSFWAAPVKKRRKIQHHQQKWTTSCSARLCR